MRIGIVGIGAMGCLFAARLHAVAEVIMLGRWAEQIATLRSDGLIYRAPDGQRQQLKVQVAQRGAAVDPVGIALILVKSYQTEAAAAAAADILQSDGVAITLQNGLGNLEQIAASVGAQRAVPGATTEGATLERPGMVRHAGRGKTYLGCPVRVHGERVRAAATLFNRAGLETEVSDTVDGVLWRKLIVNAAINPLTAVLGVPNGFLAEAGAARQIMTAVAQEAAQVAQAQGIAAGDREPGAMALEVARGTAQNSSSMLQDVRRGRPTEVEAINGSIVRLGRAHGVATPLNRALLKLVRLREQGASGPALIRELDDAEASPEVHALRQLLQEVSDASLQER